MQKLKKSEGITKSEKYLAKLCEKSFLSLWSYPNLFTDKKSNHAELCDLLVVFGNDIIIFSDKSCVFPNTGNLTTDWNRWYKRAILKSANQTYGAERWIKHHPDKIFLDQKALQALPVELPPIEKCRFHRIVIALNASERCSDYYNGDSGSLMIFPHLIGDAHIDKNNSKYSVFKVGQINPSKGFVHILDDVTLDIILSELDTISDFISYLTKKEKFILSGRLMTAAGEEELLAYYLPRVNANGEHDFVIPDDVTHLSIDIDCWAGHTKHPQYIAKKDADKISYMWDSLIERFNKPIMDGTLLTFGDDFSIGNYKFSITDHEQGVRILASEDRVSRRVLMMSVIDMIKKAPSSPFVRVMFSPRNELRGYVFILAPYNNSIDGDYEKYRVYRACMLHDYCKVLKFEVQQLTEIVGIAFQPPEDGFSSETLLYLNTEGWTLDDDKEAQKIQQEMGILLGVKDSFRRTHVQEYPDINHD